MNVFIFTFPSEYMFVYRDICIWICVCLYMHVCMCMCVFEHTRTWICQCVSVASVMLTSLLFSRRAITIPALVSWVANSILFFFYYINLSKVQSTDCTYIWQVMYVLLDTSFILTLLHSYSFYQMGKWW